MEKEISSGAMLGIVLIALAAIIGLGFGVFAIAKGTANQGVTDVQENLESVSQSAYTDFDQTIVTGTQVKSAYQNFEGKSVAVLIATQAIKDNTGTDGKIKDTAAGVKEAFASYKDGGYINQFVVFAGGSKTAHDDYDALGWKNSAGTVIPSSFVNYNAVLGANDKKVREIYFDENCYRAENGYATSSGKVVMNNISGNMSKSGMVEFLPTSARFQAYLLKDASGTVMGVVFEQISSK